MLTDELISNLQERLSLARLASEESIRIDVKTLTLLLAELSSKNVGDATLETVLTNLKNVKNDLGVTE
jgi:hypothetical protein